jgi:hypothetical protein
VLTPIGELILDSIDAYYLLIHPCFPVLPPPPTLDQSTEHGSTADEIVVARPDSPLIHALATLLALVPKRSEHAHAARHDYAESCSELALRAIDRDMDASGALTRRRFHENVPVELESTIASFIVAVYEYNYRGSMMRARTRMASVFTMAMDLGLHDIDVEITTDSECKQRAWFMIVRYCNCLIA